MTQRSEMVPDLVSVVVCAYNNWPDLEMAIESALHQSYQPVEVIVVDNSSTDATPEDVPRNFGGRVRYIRQPNRGDAGAYNTGMGVANGEFIQFLDGDDVLAPNKIEKQVEVFRARPDLDIVYGDQRRFQTLGGAADWIDEATQPEDDMLRAIIVKGGLENTLGKLFHRRVLEKVGPWDESLYVSDLDYWLRAVHAGCRFGHCPGSPMGFYRMRPGQLTKNLAAMGRGIEAVWVKALGYVASEPYRSLLTEKLAHARFCMALSRGLLPKREALAMLALARATSPKKISALVYAEGYATIFLPALSVTRSRWLRPIRRVLARLVHSRASGLGQ